MRHRRRLLAVALTAIAVVACAASPDEPATAERLDVVTEFSILADLTRAVGGERVDVHSLVPLGADPHVHEPRPSDAVRVADADLVLEHGLGLSPWMATLRSSVTGHHVVVADAVAEHAVRDDEGLLDPHLWMVPPFAAEYGRTIAEALTQVDPDGADDYTAGLDDLLAELDALDQRLQAAFATIPPGQRLLVTPHDAYAYFAEHFGLQVLGTLVGVSTEEEPSADTMRRLIDDVRDSGVPAVFIEATVPGALIERVADEAGVEVAGPLYGDSVGGPDSGADDYVRMMESNGRTIVEALGGQWS